MAIRAVRVAGAAAIVAKAALVAEEVGEGAEVVAASWVALWAA